MKRPPAAVTLHLIELKMNGTLNCISILETFQRRLTCAVHQSVQWIKLKRLSLINDAIQWKRPNSTSLWEPTALKLIEDNSIREILTCSTLSTIRKRWKLSWRELLIHLRSERMMEGEEGQAEIESNKD